jgi:hypothetical protein
MCQRRAAVPVGSEKVRRCSPQSGWRPKASGDEAAARDVDLEALPLPVVPRTDLQLEVVGELPGKAPVGAPAPGLLDEGLVDAGERVTRQRDLAVVELLLEVVDPGLPGQGDLVELSLGAQVLGDLPGVVVDGELEEPVGRVVGVDQAVARVALGARGAREGGPVELQVRAHEAADRIHALEPVDVVVALEGLLVDGPSAQAACEQHTRFPVRRAPAQALVEELLPLSLELVEDLGLAVSDAVRRPRKPVLGSDVLTHGGVLVDASAVHV